MDQRARPGVLFGPSTARCAVRDGNLLAFMIPEDFCQIVAKILRDHVAQRARRERAMPDWRVDYGQQNLAVIRLSHAVVPDVATQAFRPWRLRSARD
jgi:hypothetical protein